MFVTAFLSMWINNSAATSIMIPAAMAIVDELENFEKNFSTNDPHDEQELEQHEILPVNNEGRKKMSESFSNENKNYDFDLVCFDMKTIVEEIHEIRPSLSRIDDE